ncbi:serine carboxypeptidase [Colletotrichum scovillei]|uniref:Serine carboxypeptidase n=1 Tax=Colletotrichum scovillei TaxID=1209932 RepID=A0A9P7UDH8_9PEZI|nr:serine carboxypeptidase [Colletotrichum scovillei]KAF4778861.1 serine carboxypeptidase [Colletotrichum scovillei]KAG7044097.1 serine carboxypeptidase [Colletotrichum scovillei]KAG7046199.1 serine carboxypeptidase [Colletotrichum scovillei]KAG7063546.1 serine carboxypeptidase [Colletotrichum scovillei]
MHWLRAALLLPVAVSATLNLKQYKPSLNQPKYSNAKADFQQNVVNKAQGEPKFLTDKTKKFVVNGTKIPEVDFDVGESYAGLLNIDKNNDTAGKLYFWFFPSESQAADKEIMIWLTGGPGCSSTGELLSENGPMLWQPGMFKPIRNKWSWHRITNVVWVDQPVGTGFSQGTPTAKDEFDVARQFLSFWRNFVDTFAMQGYKVYVTGSSYSGMYCPYIASAMVDSNDKDYFNIAGMQIFDGTYSVDSIGEEIPAVPFVDRWEHVFAFNDTFRQTLKDAHEKCGYADYMRKWLVYPPAGQQPATMPGLDEDGNVKTECDTWTMILEAATEITPCFSVYSITNLCPLKYDPLGFSDGSMYRPKGAGPVYFNREDVKKAINAPLDKEWVFCTETPVFFNETDNSIDEGPGSQPVLPNVIDKTRNVILAHGTKDFVLIDDGTLLTIQNLTWGGQMGFQKKPTAPLYVPYHTNTDPETLAGAGVMGTVHSERGLTYLAVSTSGHFLAQDAPAVAFRSVEVLVGRREGFESTNTSFTIDPNTTAPVGDAGNGTVLMFPQSMEPGRGQLSGAQPVRSRGSEVSAAGGQAMFAMALATIVAVYMEF